ncbi:MAG: right-handed parallel beta-helix repeat-containing protein [Myxococcales bacterium]|nr:right-handed parallel beta-helix repeat-containing protein [Myxococcales bacterium]
MADIFISYKKEDRACTVQLSEAFRAFGLSVWWDDRIDVGASWDEEIEREIRAAKAVVVIWSPGAVQSTWVKNEARFGLNAGILRPIVAETCEIPIEFGHIQAADFRPWTDPREHASWPALLQSVEALVAGGPDAQTPLTSGASFVVDQRGAGTHTTIQAAIDDATDGTLIAVKPGTYRENLTLMKDVALVGEGEGDERPLVDGGPEQALQIGGGKARVKNLRFVNSAEPAAGVAAPAVRVLGGAPDLSRVHIQSPTWVGLFVMGAAEPVVRQSVIGPCKGDAIQCAGKCKPVFTGNKVERTTSPGMTVRDAAAPEVRGNTFTDIESNAINLGDQASGSFVDNTIRRTAAPAFYVSGFAAPEVRGNLIEDIYGNGICVCDNARGTYEGNTVRRTSTTAVVAADDSAPQLLGNTIEQVEANGVSLSGNTTAVMRDNTLTDVGSQAKRFPAVFIGEHAAPTVSNNRLSRVRGQGIYLERSAPRAIVNDNVVE